VADTGARYSIDELAALGNVSRRTVRFYVHEGLLPAPLGVGRGRHYDASHLARLHQVRALQDAGRRLDEIRVALGGDSAAADGRVETSRTAAPCRWWRIALAPGVELHVSGATRLPSQGRIEELAAWCRQHFPHDGDEDDQ
jgi:DNA-binding transcriptional MerR regulator